MSLTSARTPTLSDNTTLRVTCIEVGASSCQTTLVNGSEVSHRDGVDAPAGWPLLLAVPGLLNGRRVLAASNLGWYDVDPAEALGLEAEVSLLLGDAEAAALGEYALRGAQRDLVFVGLGTGVGGAVVDANGVVDNLLGHRTGFGDRQCRCGQRGCLETIAGGWALPPELTLRERRSVARAVGAAIQIEPRTSAELVVVGGGIARRYPDVVELIAEALPEREVTGTAAPAPAKSAAPWGLLHAFRNRP